MQFITIDKEILGGQPVFSEQEFLLSRCSTIWESGISLTEFLEDFPSVKKEQAVAVLEAANKLMNSKNIGQLYATLA